MIGRPNHVKWYECWWGAEWTVQSRLLPARSSSAAILVVIARLRAANSGASSPTLCAITGTPIRGGVPDCQREMLRGGRVPCCIESRDHSDGGYQSAHRTELHRRWLHRQRSRQMEHGVLRI